MSRTITIDPVTRIEGHARVLLDLNDAGNVSFAGLVVNELRGFERILVGMQAATMPQITARICGVCPSAHHLASAKALDAAAGVQIPPAAKVMRELLYMGHVIHSHAVHLFALAGPDLIFGLTGDPAQRNVVGLVAANPEVAKTALRLRSIGQRINELVGGRGIHPVTAVAGGMSFRFTDEDRRRLEGLADEALGLVGEVGKVLKDALMSQLAQHPELKDIAARCPSMGTVNDGKLDFYDGLLRVVDETGQQTKEFPVADYDKHLTEKAFDWSYMKAVFLKGPAGDSPYRVGALARLNCAERTGTPLADAELGEFRAAFGRTCHQSVVQLWAQLIELIHVCEKTKQLAGDPRLAGPTRVPVEFKGGRCVGHVEAPRGVLIHDYEIDAQGIVRKANLIVATQQNANAINESIKQAAEKFSKGGDQQLLGAVEFAIRCFDPCLSCATHALGEMPLELVLRHGGETVRTIKRGP